MEEERRKKNPSYSSQQRTPDADNSSEHSPIANTSVKPLALGPREAAKGEHNTRERDRQF